jgi:hypothetical protein
VLIVLDAVPEFISQRRRWLNGAFFAAVYSLIHFKQIWRTDHSMTRKILLHVEFVYQFASLMFTFFSLVRTGCRCWQSAEADGCLGQLLPDVLLHCRIFGGPKDGSFWPWDWQCHIHHPPVRVRIVNLWAIHPLSRESSTGVSAPKDTAIKACR